jgi:hypothetical protein
MDRCLRSDMRPYSRDTLLPDIQGQAGPFRDYSGFGILPAIPGPGLFRAWLRCYSLMPTDQSLPFA